MGFELRRVIGTTAAVGLLAAAIHSGNAFAQQDAARDVLNEIAETLGVEEAPNPTLYPELIEPLAGLGRLYHEEGDFRLAIAATEQARQIVRVHYGLYSAEEVPLLEQLVRSEAARGNVQAAWEIEQDLLSLIERHPTDPRMAPFLREIANRRMDVLARYERGHLPPEIVLGCYYGSGGNCRSGSRSTVVRNLSNEALSYYGYAINILLQNGGYANAELPEQLMELAEISYRYGRYAFGMNSLRHLYQYEDANAEPWNALVMMADWELMFAELVSARRHEPASMYQRAYELLEQQGADQALIDDIFSPQMPVVLPAFRPNPLVSERTADSSGYIDVAFDITKEGKSDRVEVLDSSEDAPRAAERELIRLIKRSRFRPRMTHGEVADSARVVVRYYLDDVEG